MPWSRIWRRSAEHKIANNDAHAKIESGPARTARKRRNALRAEATAKRQSSSASRRPACCRPIPRASPQGRVRWCRRSGTETGRRCRQSPTDWSALPAKTAAAALRSRQCGDQRHRVIGQRRGAHRIGAEFGAVAAGESCGSRTDPARHRARPAAPGSRTRADCPTAGAEQLDVVQIGARRGQRVGHRHHGVAVIGDEQRIGRSPAPAPPCAPRRRGRRRISRTRRCGRPCGRPPA